MFILKSYIFLSLIYLMLFFLTKKLNFLQSKYFSKHQKLIGSETIPQIGGLIFFIFIVINFSDFNYYVILFSFFILILGISSDLNYLASPSKRLLLQCLIILIFLCFFDYRINDLRINQFEYIFSSVYFKYIFTAFSILILINGSNFIDGSNGLNLGYFFLVLLVVQILKIDNSIFIENNIILISLIGISFLFILNFFNYLYLGDSGAYLLSFVIGNILIYLHNINSNISPYFIALLLWYPAFENFFSIVRKKLNKISPIDPDTNHLHQLIFKFLVNKNKFLNNYSNQITSLIIIIYNIFIFSFSINFITKTNLMILLIIFNVLVYLGVYFYLLKKIK